MSKSFWGGLLDWIKETLLETNGNINAVDLDLFYLADNVDEALEHIDNFYKKYTLKPNMQRVKMRHKKAPSYKIAWGFFK